MTIDEIAQQKNKTNLLQEFEKFKKTLTPEQLKEWHKKLEEINNDKRKFLELRCNKLNKTNTIDSGKFVVVEYENDCCIVCKENKL